MASCGTTPAFILGMECPVRNLSGPINIVDFLVGYLVSFQTKGYLSRLQPVGSYSLMAGTSVTLT